MTQFLAGLMGFFVTGALALLMGEMSIRVFGASILMVIGIRIGCTLNDLAKLNDR